MTEIISDNFYADEHSSAKDLKVFENASCTLSWRSMHGFDDEIRDEDQSDNSDDEDYKSDTISDECYSFDSEVDYDEWYDP